MKRLVGWRLPSFVGVVGVFVCSCLFLARHYDELDDYARDVAKLRLACESPPRRHRLVPRQPRDGTVSAEPRLMRRALLLAALAALPSVLTASTHVRVAYFPEPGFCELRTDGTYAGATLDYLAQLAKICDWTVEPVPCTYDEVLDRLARGDLDLVGGLADTMNHRDRFHLSTYAIGTSNMMAAKILFSFPVRPSHFCVPKGREDLAHRLDDAILRLLAEQPEFERLVLQRHFPVKPRLDLDLTPKERDYLAARQAHEARRRLA